MKDYSSNRDDAKEAHNFVHRMCGDDRTDVGYAAHILARALALIVTNADLVVSEHDLERAQHHVCDMFRHYVAEESADEKNDYARRRAEMRAAIGKMIGVGGMLGTGGASAALRECAAKGRAAIIQPFVPPGQIRESAIIPDDPETRADRYPGFEYVGLGGFFRIWRKHPEKPTA